MVFRVLKNSFLLCSCSALVLSVISVSAHAQMLTGYGDDVLEAPPIVQEPALVDDFFEGPPSDVSVPESDAAPISVVDAQAETLVADAGWRPTLSVYDDAPIITAPQPEASDSTPSADTKGDEAPVDLTADSLEYDEDAQVITASGNVMMVQDGRILRADEVVYSLTTDTAKARGHVVLNELNGDIHYSDEVEFNDKLKNGFIESLKSYLADGSRMTASNGHREDGNTSILKDATYTPCDVCEGEDPFWQIRASKVTHDQEQRRVSYNNARFELLGVPVAYAPYFSHPDGTIKRKTGFLGPTAGFRSDVGAFLGNAFYWDVAPDKDATFGLIAATEQAPIGYLEWRQRWHNARLYLQGGITYANRITRDADGNDETQPEEVRGHVIANGLWDINDKWRAGLNAEWASDDQYVRRFDFDEFNFSGNDVLENEIYAERFSGRNYASARMVAFQDVRIRDFVEDQPQILPEIVANFRGEPGALPVIGGSWSLNTSVLGLRREGNEQDIMRFGIDGGWKRRLVSDYGLLTNVQANVRGDFYNVTDRNVATAGSGQDDSNAENRFFPNFQIQSSYPVIRGFEKMQASIEPIVSLTFAPNIDVNNDIPNEDSRDVQIDALNIFEANRFPGLDRIEDQSKVTYGLRTGLYGYEGSRGEVFIGQSHRFADDDNPFPSGSGLDQQDSDIVGQITGAYKNNFNMDYRFQLASENMSSQRHEVDASANWNRLRLSSRYLFANGLGGTEIAESREQLTTSAAYYVAEDWRVNVAARQDLGAQPGLRTAALGLDYLGQCVSLSLTAQRNLTAEASGDNNTEIFFRIGLKNLGEFVESDLRRDRITE